MITIESINNYCKLRSQAFNDYCVKNGFQLDGAAQQKFFEFESQMIDGKPNPIFVQTMAQISPEHTNANPTVTTTTNPTVATTTNPTVATATNPTVTTATNPTVTTATNTTPVASVGANVNAVNSVGATSVQSPVPTKTAINQKLDFKTMTMDQLMSFLNLGINDNGPTPVTYLTAALGQNITENVIPAAIEFLARNPQLPSVDLKNLNGIDLHLTRESTLEDLTAQWKTSIEAKAQAAKETQAIQTPVTPVVEKTATEQPGPQTINVVSGENNSIEKIVPRQNFKGMSIDQLTGYVRFGINDNGPTPTPYLSGAAGDIKTEVIPAAMEYLARNPQLQSIDLKNLNGIDLVITRESSLDDLAATWQTTMDQRVAEAEARRASVAISDEMRAKYGSTYDLDGIAAGPNATEVLTDLPAFDNLAKGSAAVQQQSMTAKVDAVPVATPIINATEN